MLPPKFSIAIYFIKRAAIFEFILSIYLPSGHDDVRVAGEDGGPAHHDGLQEPFTYDIRKIIGFWTPPVCNQLTLPAF